MADTGSAADLDALLGAPPPPGVAALSASEREQLAQVLREARHAQAADLQEAFAQALRHVPFPVRGIVKKVLVG
ncbi:MAG: hypothetical protein EPN43_04340 [Jatrophihabitans sp.]|nr:MAG: hypothetical protein EPN43_04340 [Jatrophihabitans sp.]